MVHILRTQLAYSAWASGKLVEAAAQLSPEELTRNFGTADGSVLGTLVHIFAADRIWLGRMRGNPPAKFIVPENDMHFAVLQNDWPKVHEGWAQWAASIGDEDATARLAFKDLGGKPHEIPVWQIVLHVVNHGTHHRGQVSGFLRAMGHAPPWVDSIAYCREKAIPATA